MGVEAQIREFLRVGPHAVAGASNDRNKFGNRVLRTYLQHGMPVYVLHPALDMVEGLPVYRTLADLPEKPHGLSIITPPQVSLRLVEQAAAAGVKHLWLQPGAESPGVLQRARELGLDAIAGGPCLLVELGFRQEGTP